MAFDVAGDLFVIDDATVRKVTRNGNVTTLAGSSLPNYTVSSGPPRDGVGEQARFQYPTGLDFDTTGNLYISDSCYVRKMTPDRTVSTIGNLGNGAYCSLGQSHLTADAAGNLYGYVWEASGGYRDFPRFYFNGMVKFSSSAGGAALVSGTTPFAYLGGTADKGGNVYYIDGQDQMYRMTPDGTASPLFTLSKSVRAVADGTLVRDLVRAADGSFFMLLKGDRAIYKIAHDGQVTIVAGAPDEEGSVDGPVVQARFRDLTSLAIDQDGNLFVADNGNHTLRKITPAGVVSTFAGGVNYYAAGTADGKGEEARFTSLKGITTDAAGNLYMADSRAEVKRIARLSPSGVVSTVYQHPDSESGAVIQKLQDIAIDRAGNLYAADFRTIYRITPGGGLQTFAAGLDYINNMVIDSQDNLYVTDGRRLRKVNVVGQVSDLAGSSIQSALVDGAGSAAHLKDPGPLAFDKSGNLYFLDAGSLRRFTPDGGVTTIAAPDERLVGATGITLGADGNFYVAASTRNLLMKVTPSGESTAVAGTSLHTDAELGQLPDALGMLYGIVHLGSNAFAVTLPTAVVKVQLP